MQNSNSYGFQWVECKTMLKLGLCVVRPPRFLLAKYFSIYCPKALAPIADKILYV